jgi:hypothetical protein
VAYAGRKTPAAGAAERRLQRSPATGHVVVTERYGTRAEEARG